MIEELGWINQTIDICSVRSRYEEESDLFGSIGIQRLHYCYADGNLKIISGALVAMKGGQSNNLYYYIGNTIIGSAATTLSEEHKNVEVTKLWHMLVRNIYKFW